MPCAHEHRPLQEYCRNCNSIEVNLEIGVVIKMSWGRSIHFVIAVYLFTHHPDFTSSAINNLCSPPPTEENCVWCVDDLVSTRYVWSGERGICIPISCCLSPSSDDTKVSFATEMHCMEVCSAQLPPGTQWLLARA